MFSQFTMLTFSMLSIRNQMLQRMYIWFLSKNINFINQRKHRHIKRFISSKINYASTIIDLALIFSEGKLKNYDQTQQWCKQYNCKNIYSYNIGYYVNTKSQKYQD